jgi:aldehyde:ferredoxin oxidoreductase
MAGGYTGKLLWVDLSRGELREETPGESVYRDYIGGYGLGARLLYSRQRPGVDPLGPENTLGLVTGPLTGTPATFGCRFAAVGKSPLTGGWGDANCGGEFGPYLKFAGYDAVFFTGTAAAPVYLSISNGRPALRDAAHLWGNTTFETDDILEAEHGRRARVVSIGPAGENLSLVSCLITQRGSAAARSGLGAVMGSKKLKAVVAAGDLAVPIADEAAAIKLRQQHIRELMKGPIYTELGTYGTCVHTDSSAHSGDTPVKNWSGIGVIDLPDVSGLHKDVLKARVASRTGCWHCPVACRHVLKSSDGDFAYPAGARQPEYETFGSFGANCLNSDPESITALNHICNAFGLDTISTGSILAFAMECYEHGLITTADTGGIELTWGNRRGMIALTEKIARREGLGDVLADGAKRAAERIGRGAEAYAVHAGGQEPGMHDPKCDFPAFAGKPAAARYQMDATPGRHTAGFGPSQFQDHVVNAAGLCLHSDLAVENPRDYLVGFMKAVTGWNRSLEDLLKAGERIANMRHVFTLREGDNPLRRYIHPRIVGIPPQTDGPLAGVTADIEMQIAANLEALDWDRETARPGRQKLHELDMDDVIPDLYP